jgi:hypothetical protein
MDTEKTKATKKVSKTAKTTATKKTTKKVTKTKAKTATTKKVATKTTKKTTKKAPAKTSAVKAEPKTQVAQPEPKKEPRKMGAKEFMEVAKTLTPKIKACSDVAGFERVMAQEVLQAVSRSVMVNGAQQHGLKQVKLKAALKVYSILAADREHNTEQEQAVLNALVIIASGAIRR